LQQERIFDLDTIYYWQYLTRRRRSCRRKYYASK